MRVIVHPHQATGQRAAPVTSSRRRCPFASHRRGTPTDPSLPAPSDAHLFLLRISTRTRPPHPWSAHSLSGSAPLISTKGQCFDFALGSRQPARETSKSKSARLRRVQALYGAGWRGGSVGRGCICHAPAARAHSRAPAERARLILCFCSRNGKGRGCGWRAATLFAVDAEGVGSAVRATS